MKLCKLAQCSYTLQIKAAGSPLSKVSSLANDTAGSPTASPAKKPSSLPVELPTKQPSQNQDAGDHCLLLILSVQVHFSFGMK